MCTHNVKEKKLLFNVTLTTVASLSLANMSRTKESLRTSYFDNIFTGINHKSRKISATNRKSMYIGWRLSSGNYGRYNKMKLSSILFLKSKMLKSGIDPF